MRPMSSGRLWTGTILVIASLIGLLALFAPFSQPNLSQSASGMGVHAQDAPVLSILLVALCLGAMLAALSSGVMNAKVVAILGMLTAINAVLRAVPGPAGFAAVFVLPILCGYVYGATFGFLLGALSLLVSALIGAGIGPWLPYQMLAAGWVGMTSAWLPKVRWREGLQVAVLAIWGLLWGFAFGMIMNIWFWPFVFQPQQADLYWRPGMPLSQVLENYAVFYLVTSFWWDLGRALGNGLLILLLGRPILRLLRRFQRRFQFTLEDS